MATAENVQPLTGRCGADLRDSIYEIVTLNAAAQLIKASADSAFVLGLVDISLPTRDPDPTGLRDVPYATFCPNSKVKCKAQAAVAVGDFVIPAAAANAGKVIGKAALDPGEISLGVALEAASGDNSIFQVQPLAVQGAIPDNYYVPEGGANNERLTKASAADRNVEWAA